MSEEQEYVVHAAVNVPVYCQFRVMAKSQEEAEQKAMKPVIDDESCAEEFRSDIWQNGNWTKNVYWPAADEFRILGVSMDPRTAEMVLHTPEAVALWGKAPDVEPRKTR